MARQGIRQHGIMLALTVGLSLSLGFGDGRAAEPESDTALEGHAEAFIVRSLIGVLNLPQATLGRQAPVVVLVHDALGPDSRGESYIVQLLGAGIAVLEVLGPDDEPVALGAALDALAGDHRLDGSRIGVLGFGAGAAAATSHDARLTVRALLYPGCSTLTEGASVTSLPAGTRLLLMHGGADPTNESMVCAGAAATLATRGAAVRRIEYPGAGYAWDRPSFGLEQRALLPAPGTPQRVPSISWPALTTLSATQVAGFFASAFRDLQR